MGKIIANTLKEMQIEKQTEKLAELFSNLKRPFNIIRGLLLDFYKIPSIKKLKVTADNEKQISYKLVKIHANIKSQLKLIFKVITQINSIMDILIKEGVDFRNPEKLTILVNVDIVNVNGFTAQMEELKMFLEEEDLYGMSVLLPPPDWNDLKKAYKELTIKLDSYLELVRIKALNLKQVDPYFKG